MSIRKKTLLIVGATFLILLATLMINSRLVIFGGFTELEREDVKVSVQRAINAISETVQTLDSTVQDWAFWNDTYAFVQNHDPLYLENNLTDDTLIDLKINFMLFFNSRFDLVAAKFVDLDQGKAGPVPKDLLRAIFSAKTVLSAHDAMAKKSGILMVGEIPVPLASRPILKSDESGPARGMLIIGKYLTPNEMNRLSHLTQLSLSVRPASDPNLPFPADERERFHDSVFIHKAMDKDWIAGYAVQKDVSGNPGYVVMAQLPRGIFAQGRKVWLLSMISLLITGLSLSLVIMLFLEKIVLLPLNRLIRRISEIGEKYDTSVPVPVESRDELGILAQKINQMLSLITEKTAQLEEMNRVLKEDISRRKLAEQALKESERRYRSILDAVPNAISISGWADEQYKEVNDAFTRTTGFSREEVIGKTLAELNGYVDMKDRLEVARRLKKDGRITGMDLALRMKDGHILDVVFSGRQMSYNNEICLAASIIDDTDRKHAEIEKNRLKAQLQRAQKMEAIGTLAGGVAHDLNNILSGLVSYPELLLMEIPEDSPLRQPITTIKNSGKRAAEIVQDLLTLARRGFAAHEVVNLNDTIMEYLTSLEHERLQANHPGVVVETRLEVRLFNISGSPVHLLKTLMNLVLNSAEALPEGGTIFISTENRYIDVPIGNYDQVEEGEYVLLTVSDTGVGISRKDLDRIFEPFYTKKVMGRKGTGLGMSVVWGTIKDHRGYIDVSSAPGKGTVFTLYFPVTREEIVLKTHPAVFESYTGNGETILVVDDIREQREIASHMLEKLGYSVSAVPGGEEAVVWLQETPADLVVLDMIMDPGMDGLDTYQKIREIRPGQKVIIASGYSETDRVRKARNLGAGEYVKKPYTLETIGLAVKTELRGKRG